MREEDFLDRERIDVVRAADDQVLGATGDPEIAVVVDAAEVARVDPAGLDERGAVVRFAEIAAEDAGARHRDNADLAARTLAPHLAVAVDLDDAHAAVRH